MSQIKTVEYSIKQLLCSMSLVDYLITISVSEINYLCMESPKHAPYENSSTQLKKYLAHTVCWRDKQALSAVTGKLSECLVLGYTYTVKVKTIRGIYPTYRPF